MTENIELKYEIHKLESYIIDLLTMEACRLFLPAAFIKTEEGVTASYHTEGYRRLADFQEMSTENVFNIMLSLTESVKDAQRHYIFEDEYEIAMDNIFVDQKISRARLLFLPAEQDVPLVDKMTVLLAKLAEIAPEEGREYIDDAIAFIRQEAFGSKAVIHHLEKLRKEIYLCGVK